MCDKNHPAPASPKGWMLVPKEPTREMNVAPFHGSFSNGADRIRMKNIYKAMLSATPAPPTNTGD